MHTTTKQRERGPVGSTREYLGANFNRWWLLPLGILSASALIAASVMVFGPSFIGPPPAADTGPPIADCSGFRANDYSCYQERYQELV